jgi:uncharacterized YccA/Bax inhibitor family protein
MNLLSILSSVYSVIQPFLGSPAGQRIDAAASAILMAYVMQKASVVIDGYTVSAANTGGVPIAFKLTDLGVAVAHIVAGQEGDITVGSTVISIVKNPA